MLLVAVLMLAASMYEGYLERKYRMNAALKDLELARHGNDPKSVGTFV